MGKLFVVMYHYTRDLKHSRYPEIKGLDVSLFREQIEFMKQQFNIVSMEQVIEAVERHADLPDKALLLTFDDGCNGVQREHNKKLNNGLPILHKVPPKRDYGRYFCIMAEKGGTSHGGLTEKLSLFFHAVCPAKLDHTSRCKSGHGNRQ